MISLKRFRPTQVRELSLLLLILIAIMLFGALIDNYYSSRTFVRISTSVAVIAVVSIGQTVVMLTRNIDLSVGSIVGCTAYVVGSLLGHFNGMSPIVVVAICLAMGAVLGMVNGLLVAYGGVPSIITTLGTLAIYRGMLVSFSGAKNVTSASLPTWIVDLSRANAFSLNGLDIRLLFMIAIVLMVAFQLALTFFRPARAFYAIGSNPEAARLIGLPIKRTVFVAFLLSGALAGLAGFMTLARFGNITTEAARGLELQVVAAAVVGGVNIFGGSGSVVGAFFGAVLIGTLEQSLFRLPVSEFWRDAVLGLMILLAVASDRLLLQRLVLWGPGNLKRGGAPSKSSAAAAPERAPS